MPQLNFYVSKEVAEELRRRAKKRKLPLSRYIAEVVAKEVRPGWPPGYFEATFGKWKGEWPEIHDPPPEPIEPLFE